MVDEIHYTPMLLHSLPKRLSFTRNLASPHRPFAFLQETQEMFAYTPKPFNNMRGRNLFLTEERKSSWMT